MGLGSAGRRENGSIYRTALDGRQFPPDPGKVDSGNQGDTIVGLRADQLPPDIDKSSIITVRLSQSESLIVPVTIDRLEVQAVVDCGAGACIMRKQLYEQLDLKPPFLRSVYLRGIGEGYIPGYQIKISVKVGSTIYNGTAFVTTMNDDFLLGLDFMKSTLCDILISESCIRIGGEKGEKIPAVLKRVESRDYEISRVVTARRVVVPAGTGANIRVEMLEPISEDKMFYVEPHGKNRGLAVSSVLVSGKKKARVQVLNLTEDNVILRKGHSVGWATQVGEIVSEEDEEETLLKADCGQSAGSVSSSSQEMSDCGQSDMSLINQGLGGVQMKTVESTSGVDCGQSTSGTSAVGNFETGVDCGQSTSGISTMGNFRIGVDCGQSAPGATAVRVCKGSVDCGQSTSGMSTVGNSKGSVDCGQSTLGRTTAVNSGYDVDCGQSTSVRSSGVNSLGGVDCGQSTTTKSDCGQSDRYLNETLGQSEATQLNWEQLIVVNQLTTSRLDLFQSTPVLCINECLSTCVKCTKSQ